LTPNLNLIGKRRLDWSGGNGTSEENRSGDFEIRNPDCEIRLNEPLWNDGM